MMRPMCQVSLSWNQQDMDPSWSQIFVPANEAGQLSITNHLEMFNGSKIPGGVCLDRTMDDFFCSVLQKQSKNYISQNAIPYRIQVRAAARELWKEEEKQSPLSCSGGCI